MRSRQLDFINELVGERKHWWSWATSMPAAKAARCDVRRQDRAHRNRPAIGNFLSSWRPVRRIDRILVSHSARVAAHASSTMRCRSPADSASSWLPGGIRLAALRPACAKMATDWRSAISELADRHEQQSVARLPTQSADLTRLIVRAVACSGLILRLDPHLNRLAKCGESGYRPATCCRQAEALARSDQPVRMPLEQRARSGQVLQRLLAHTGLGPRQTGDVLCPMGLAVAADPARASTRQLDRVGRSPRVPPAQPAGGEDRSAGSSGQARR